jgi:hypothetical protein
VPNDKNIKEFTLRAIILGALFGLLFGDITVTCNGVTDDLPYK